MTVPVRRRNVGTVLEDHDVRILRLEREPRDACCTPPWVRLMRLENDPITIPDGSQTQINFDPDIIWGSDDWEDFFTIDFAAGFAVSIVPITPGGGRYGWSAEAKWDDDFPETCNLELSEANIGEWSYSKQFSRNAIVGLQLPGTQAFYFEEQHGGGVGFQLAAAQGSAVDRDINGIYFEMAYLGSYTFTSTSTMTGFEQ